MVWQICCRKSVCRTRQMSGASFCSASSASVWTSGPWPSLAASCATVLSTLIMQRAPMPNLYPDPSCSPVCSFNGIDHLTSDVLLDGWTQKWLSHSLRLMSNKVLIRRHAVACSAAAGPVTLLLRAVPVLLYRADFHDCIAHTGSISACVLTVTCPPLQACHVGTFLGISAAFPACSLIHCNCRHTT